MERVNYFVKQGILEVSEDHLQAKIVNTEKSMALIEFFSQLVKPLIDSYSITLTAVEQLCGKNLVIKQKTLVKELHVGLKRLYAKGNIPTLHSCLKETIKSALERFEQMGLLETTTYKTKKGNMTVFLRSPAESVNPISKLLDQMHQHRHISKAD